MTEEYWTEIDAYQFAAIVQDSVEIHCGDTVRVQNGTNTVRYKGVVTNVMRIGVPGDMKKFTYLLEIRRDDRNGRIVTWDERREGARLWGWWSKRIYG